jgi:hypothetical protein
MREASAPSGDDRMPYLTGSEQRRSRAGRQAQDPLRYGGGQTRRLSETTVIADDAEDDEGMHAATHAVLDAADNWLAAVQAIRAADESGNRTQSEAQEWELDGAEVQLAAAVQEWRDAGRPV